MSVWSMSFHFLLRGGVHFRAREVHTRARVRQHLLERQPDAHHGDRMAGMIMAACLALVAPLCHAGQFYHLQSAVTLPGRSPAWDYLTLDPGRPYLFIGRRHDGVTVYDLANRHVVATIADSRGANKAILIPTLDLGYTVNGDGSTTEFRLSTLKTIRRIHVGSSADAGSYEPVTKQLLVTMGDQNVLGFVNAARGTVVARLPMHSRKLEASAADGRGDVFMAERDRNRVVRIDARHHRVTATWSTAPCEEPTGLAYDTAHRRIFVGCRGDHPMLAILNADTGKLVATVPIGRGNDGVAYNPSNHRIYTSNGIDGNLVIIDQQDPDHYRLDQAITTRPMARTLALDARRHRIYLVTAEGAVDPRKKVDTEVAPFYPNTYFDNTFTVLTYSK